MCGICGKVNFNRDEPVSPGLLRQMTRLIAHRGPDGDGHYLSGPAALGHRRLSIIDLNTGAQPMSNEDGTIWVVFNGEIYNFVELRRQLIARGHQFKSSSDTEVIVHLYEEYGDAGVARLDGMFSFALWDECRQRLLLARDRVGIKPLYYIDTGRSLVFGSEIKAITADPSVSRSLDLTALDRFLTYYYLPGDLTLLSGIRKLEPGHYLSLESGRTAITRYWDLAFSTPKEATTLKASAERLRHLITKTVKSHMISDVPVGVLLSGGVDSTGILAAASKHASGPLHTFTVGFSSPGTVDERPFARLASRDFGSIHHEATLSPVAFRDFLPDYVRHMEEPVCEPPALALYFIAKLARDCGVKVLLSGEGADEAFAGYPEYRNLVALERLKAAFGAAKPLLAAGFGVLGHLGWERGKHYQSLVGQQVDSYYLSRTSTPDSLLSQFKGQLHGPGLLVRGEHGAGDGPTRRLLESVADQPLLNRLLYVDTKTWLPDDLLVKADKMTMAASVELRVPFLDHHMLEFAASLPLHHKASGTSLKKVLKEALRPSIPKAILTRKKAGFPVPYEHWMRHELRDFVHDTLLSADSWGLHHFRRSAIEELLDGFTKGRACPKEVFGLLVLNLWHAQIFRAPAPVEDDGALPHVVSGAQARAGA